MKNLLAVLLLLSGIATTANAQNLSKMSEKERNEKLVKVAKKAIADYAPDYLRYTKGNYEISLVVKNNSGEMIRSYYIVGFTDYDRKEESFINKYPVSVEIWADNCVASGITSGSMWGIIIPEIKTRGQEIPKLEYKKRPPYKQNTGRTQTFS